MVIMPLIIGGAAIAVMTTLSDQSGVSNRVADSFGVQITSANFVRDVQSATTLTTATPSSPQCDPTTDAQLLGLGWTSSSGAAILISYVETPLPSTPGAYELVRRFCQNGSLTSALVVAHSLITSPFAPAVTCGTCTAAPGWPGWVNTAGISGVTIAAASANDARSNPASYEFSLTAVPRSWTPQSGGVTEGGFPPTPPLFLLGSGGLSCPGGGILDVNGELAVNSTANGSINVGPGATVESTGPNSEIYSASTQSPQSAISGSGAYSPTTITYGGQISDPYTALTPPSLSGLPTYSGPSNQGPGIYTNTLTLSGTSTTTLASGIYVLEAGISVSGGASVSSATSGSTTGVLFYVTGGAVQFTGSGALNLQPLSADPPSPAPNLLIWQNASDSSQMTLAGNSSTFSLQGLIYAPSAPVLAGGNGSLAASSVISSSLSCSASGHGTTSIG